MHKEGIRTDVINISILHMLNKKFENNYKLSNFINYSENRGLITHHQCGFRKNQITILTLVKFRDKVLEAMNNGKSVLGIFLDFSKNHKILVDKLKNLSFLKTSITLIANYLFQSQATHCGKLHLF